MQEDLIEKYNLLDLVFETINIVRNLEGETMLLATEAYTKVLSHVVEKSNHNDIFSYRVGNGLALTMINSMFHDT